MEALRCGLMDVATTLTEATVTLHFFVAGLPILYFLGFRAVAMKLCAGAHSGTGEAHAAPPLLVAGAELLQLKVGLFISADLPIQASLSPPT